MQRHINLSRKFTPIMVLSRRSSPIALAAACVLCATGAQAQSLKVLLSPPAVQNTGVGGALVETFDTGSSSIAGTTGTWTVGGFDAATGSLAPANQYGGAGGTGRFLNVGGGPIEVALTPGYRYVGFWWSAGDASNAITFYDNNGNQLIHFTTADIVSLLSGPGNVTAINGTAYPKANYFGNPNPNFPGQNGNEPYAYVNLILDNSTVTFGRVEIEGSNFELDNLALAYPPAAPPVEWVEVKDYPVVLAANDDAYATVAGQPVSGNVSTNDPAASAGVTATYTVVTGPANGSLGSTFNPATGTFIYTPNPGFAGTDTFTYSRCRPGLPGSPDLCDEATVTITVIDAVNDSASTTANTPVPGNAASNDQGIPTGSTFSKAGDPSHGTATVNPDGSYTYTPANGFAGVDSFNYTVCMPSPNQAVCDTATVAVTVRPIANDDTGITRAGEPLNGPLQGNDAGVVTGSIFELVNGPAAGTGTATVNPDGTYIYTPAPGYTGPATFTYRLCVPPQPNQALCDDATVTINVLGANDDSAVTKVDTPVSGNVGSNDGTRPPGSTFNKTGDPSHGTVTLGPDGGYTYTPAPGYKGPDSFTYEVCSGSVCAPARVDLYVMGAEDDTTSTTPGNPVSGKVGDNDNVPPGSTFTGPSNGPSHGSVTMEPDGSYTYTPDRTFTGEDSFEYEVCAPAPNQSTCVTAKVTIRVAMPKAVPTLSEWAMLLLSGLMAMGVALRRRV